MFSPHRVGQTIGRDGRTGAHRECREHRPVASGESVRGTVDAHLTEYVQPHYTSLTAAIAQVNVSFPQP